MASENRITGPLWRNPPVTGGIPSQRASNADSVSTFWRHPDLQVSKPRLFIPASHMGPARWVSPLAVRTIGCTSNTRYFPVPVVPANACPVTSASLGQYQALPATVPWAEDHVVWSNEPTKVVAEIVNIEDYDGGTWPSWRPQQMTGVSDHWQPRIYWWPGSKLGVKCLGWEPISTKQ